jgi:site-specific recombinase XerD
MDSAIFHKHGAPDYWLYLLNRGVKIKQIDKKNADIIKKFIEYEKASRYIKGMRSSKIAQTLISWRKFYSGDWSEINPEYLTESINRLLNYKTVRGQNYAPNTVADHINILKTFYSWMIKRKLTTLTREDLAEIHTPKIPETREAKDMITRQEVAEMIAACKSHRDQAIIAVTFESAGRINEIAGAKWGDLEYTPEGAIKLTIDDQKNNVKRLTPLLMSVEYLAAWRRVYSGTPDGDNLIFTDSVSGGPMEYRAIAYVITRAAKRAGIKKRITPHLFRGSRITEMVKDGYHEGVIREIAWANQNTNMMKTYLKLGNDDIYNEFLDKTGVKKKADLSKQNVPKQCPFCFAMNSPIAQHCHMCGIQLTEEARNYQESWKKAIASNPDFMINILMDIKKERAVEEK